MGEETQETPDKKASPGDNKDNGGKNRKKFSIGGLDGRKSNDYKEIVKEIALHVGNKHDMSLKRLVLNEKEVKNILEEPDYPDKENYGEGKEKSMSKYEGDVAKWRIRYDNYERELRILTKE